MNRRGFLASKGGFEPCTGGFETRPYKRRPPGWPLLEALFIAALILLASVTVDLIANLAGCADGP
jgi:hypothetical protein